MHRIVRLTALIGVAAGVALATACVPNECKEEKVSIVAYDNIPVELDCEEINGDLVIEGSALLPNLRKVTGSIELVPRIYTETLEFPVLKEVGGDFSMLLLQGLTELDIDKLETVGGSLRFYDVALDPLIVPEVTSVGGYLEFSIGAATTIEVPKVEYVGVALAVQSTTALTDFSMPRLHTVDSFVVVHDNQELTSFNLDGLTSVATSLDVFNNPKLPACEVDAWIAGVSAETTKTDGNDIRATCP